MSSRKSTAGLRGVVPLLALVATIGAALTGLAPRASAATTYTASLSGTQESPPNASPATGFATVVLSTDETMITVDLTFSGLTAPATAAHIHGPAAPGTNAPVLLTFIGFPATTSGTYMQSFAITPTQVVQLKGGLLYVNIHNATFPGGEIRGQLVSASTAARMGRIAASRTPAGVLVRWRTASELDLLGFNVYRQVNGQRKRLNARLIGAHGAGAYSYLDRYAPQRKRVRFWIQAVNVDGSRNWYGPAEVARTLS